MLLNFGELVLEINVTFSKLIYSFIVQQTAKDYTNEKA